MDKPSFKLVGSPCGQHGQYTFYKALRISGPQIQERIIAIGDFFFVKIWQDSELVSIGELQLLWTDRVSDQTLVSLRLYFLPENTPEGRANHGEHEVLVINEKVVLKAEDLVSWVWSGAGWRVGLRGVWRGACAPPPPRTHTDPLYATSIDFSDVEKEKSALEVDPDTPGVVVFSYPRYCRYRAVVARLEGLQQAWLRDSLVAALGGYAAPTRNTSILYCKDTFEYPELEGHEFVCNQLAPRLKGRPRGRRRRPATARSRSHSPSERSSDSDSVGQNVKDLPITPRRLSLRNGASISDRQSSEEERDESREEREFASQLRLFHRRRGSIGNVAFSLKHLSLKALYDNVISRGGYDAMCRNKLWRVLFADRPARVRTHYERYLLPYENHERERNGLIRRNGKCEKDREIDTIDVTESPLRESSLKEETPTKTDPEKRLRTPSPKPEPKEKPEDLNITSKPAEELNKEFLDSLPTQKDGQNYIQKEEKSVKITLKPVEKLIETNYKEKNALAKLFEENSALVAELAAKHKVEDSNKLLDDIGNKQISGTGSMFLSELAHRLNLVNADTSLLKELSALSPEPGGGGGGMCSVATLTLTERYALNGHHNGVHQNVSRPAGRSSLRHVRVKPTRPPHNAANQPSSLRPLRPDSASHSPPVPAKNTANSDDEIVEVPYKPKTPEIIDLDEYPESPQSQSKKKKLDILKERGLEVTPIPTPAWPVPPVPLMGGINPPLILNPAMQHQIMTQASLFQMYNIIPQNYPNGIHPPKVFQATCIYGTTGPEKTVYGNPKDPFMPPPHVLQGAPIKSQRNVLPTTTTQELPPRQGILDLTCKNMTSSPNQKPAVEIVRIPSAPSPSKNTAQNLSKNYTLIDGKAVVGSNLEITLVNPKSTNNNKTRPPQKRSSNGKFVSTKTPTPPKDYPKPYPSPSNIKKTQIIVPNYQISRDDISPTSSTSSKDSQSIKSQDLKSNPYDLQKLGPSLLDIQKLGPNLLDMQKSATNLLDMQKSASNLLDMQKNAANLLDMQKNAANLLDMQKNAANLIDMQKNSANLLEMQKNAANLLDMQKNAANLLDMQKSVPAMSPFMDPLYMSALYNSLAGQMDQRQLAMYRDFMANQFRGYSGLLGAVTPTTKN